MSFNSISKYATGFEMPEDSEYHTVDAMLKYSLGREFFGVWETGSHFLESVQEVKKYSLIKNICSKNLIFAKTNLFIVNS